MIIRVFIVDEKVYIGTNSPLTETYWLGQGHFQPMFVGLWMMGMECSCLCILKIVLQSHLALLYIAVQFWKAASENIQFS